MLDGVTGSADCFFSDSVVSLLATDFSAVEVEWVASVTGDSFPVVATLLAPVPAVDGTGFAAEVSDERSAYMTRGHNNSRMITMGAEFVGDELAKTIAKGFVNGNYDGGRLQIRVDMLNKMC